MYINDHRIWTDCWMTWSEDGAAEVVVWSMELQKAEIRRDIITNMGAIIKTRLKGTIHSCLFVGWNWNTHQPNTSPPVRHATTIEITQVAILQLFIFPFLFLSLSSSFIADSIGNPASSSPPLANLHVWSITTNSTNKLFRRTRNGWTKKKEKKKQRKWEGGREREMAV